jgi:hypothetical protein
MASFSDHRVRDLSGSTFVAAIVIAACACSGKMDAVAPCFEGETAVEGSCALVCTSDGECSQEDQRCIPVDGGTPYCGCDPNLCGEREDCRSPTSYCDEVPCSERVACESSLDFCDIDRRRCFAKNGQCQDQSCPTIPWEFRTYAATECGADGFCKVSKVVSSPAFLSPQRSNPLAVKEPGGGAVFEAPAAPRFCWESVSEPVIALVLNEQPKATDDLHRYAIWGAAVPAGEGSCVEWGEGNAIDGDDWLSASPRPLDVGVYYLLVQAVDGERLNQLSTLVAFVVGEPDVPAWPEPGERCSERGAAGECEHPSTVMVCDGTRCRQLCGSDAECGGARVCELPDEQFKVRLCSR